MKTVTPKEFIKDYSANYKQLGHSGAFQILRSRITFSLRYGHAWFMDHRKQIEKEVAEIESKIQKESNNE